MRLIESAQLPPIFRSYGVQPQPSYADNHYLEFVGHRESRFWESPPEPRRITAFLRHHLQGMDPWKEMILWPRRGKWVFSFPPENLNDAIAHSIISAAGFPENAHGAAILPLAEITQIVAILFSHICFGVSVSDDVYIIPDHGLQLLQIDHHDVVHVHCRTSKRMKWFVDHMARSEYALPTELPDPSFKPPPWMAGDKPDG